MHTGRLLDQGTHDELIARGGMYQKLVKRQLAPSGGQTSELSLTELELAAAPTAEEPDRG